MLGAAGLAIPLVGGRWGSYIGISPIFLADALVILGALLTLMLPKSYPALPRFPRVYWLFWTATALFIVTSILQGYGDLVTRVRDLIPWFYLLLLPAVVQWAMVAGSRRILGYLTITLLAHAAWAIPAMLGVLPSIDLPANVFGEALFGVRADVDVPLLAASVVLVFHRWGTRPATVVFLALAAGAATAQTSRAALVSSVLAVVVFAFMRGHLRGAQGVMRVLAIVPVVALIVVVLLPRLSLSGDQFDSGALARAGVYGSAEASASGDGTANARFEAWGILIDHYAEQGYPALGLGAGAEIVRDTGAVRYLSGDVAVRAPHNWWVHALVRTGYIGLLLWTTLLATGARLRSGRWKDRDAGFDTAMGALLMTSMCLTSTLGVVVEAPFGSQVLLVGAALFGLSAQYQGILGKS
ncbi:MAG: O-antigen ligase family protein [Pseudonocardiaceae bacterium]